MAPLHRMPQLLTEQADSQKPFSWTVQVPGQSPRSSSSTYYVPGYSEAGPAMGWQGNADFLLLAIILRNYIFNQSHHFTSFHFLLYPSSTLLTSGLPCSSRFHSLTSPVKEDAEWVFLNSLPFQWARATGSRSSQNSAETLCLPSPSS